MRALTALSLLLLSACGQSGDLYLPADQPEPAQAPAAPADPAATPPAEEKPARPEVKPEVKK